MIRRNGLTDAERAEILRLRKRGLSMRDVARAVGRSESTVRNALIAAGAGSSGGMARGRAHYCAKLDERKVRAIRKRRDGGESCLALAGEFGVDQVTVRLAADRKTWKHVR